MAINRPHDALGSGQVQYGAQRPILHFGTPPAEAEKALRMDRLRSNGFILDVSEGSN